MEHAPPATELDWRGLTFYVLGALMSAEQENTDTWMAYQKEVIRLAKDQIRKLDRQKIG